MAPVAGSGPAGVLDAAGSSAHFATGRHLHGRPVVAIYTPDGGGVRAGCFLYVEPDVELMIGGNHRVDWVTTFPVREIFDLPGARIGIPWSKGDIVIGHGVRLGRGARVISSVTIGDGAAVAPYSVVVRDVRPYSVVAGNPARQVGLRFDQDVVDRLTGTAWWGWHDDLTVWRLDRLTGGQAHVLVPQLGGHGSEGRRAPVRSALAHLLRGLAHRLDVPVEPTAQAPAGSPDGTSAGTSAGSPLPPPAAAATPATPTAPVTGDVTLPAASAATISMGLASYGCPIVHGPADRVTIGSYCSIAPGTTIVVEAPTGAGSSRDVRFGSDVWVGRQANILPGVTIGDGAVIAAYSVVADDVTPFAVVAGNPAREVKRRFDHATIEALLRIRWWEWSEEVVQGRALELCSDDLGGFIARYDPQPTTSHPANL